jgi:LysR family transcriptional regulator, transcriptional activator for leuABCD operon
MFNLRSLDLNLLTVFEAIYELGTVSAAADRLALSQSATSHALSRLRDACRDELFVRVHQGLSPTPVAKSMYPAIKQALEALRTSLAEASGFDPAQSQRKFSISIPHPMGPFYALDLRAAVAAVAPGVVLTFDTVSRPVDLETNLREGIVDVAIDWLPIELNPFVNKRLFDDRLMLIAREDHPAIKGRATFEDLLKVEFVGPHRRRDVDRLPHALREFYNLEIREAVRVSELLEIATVVASTDLLGVFPSSMTPLLAKRLRLRVLPMPVDLPALPIYMVWHETRRNDSAHRWLREVIEARFDRFAKGYTADGF